MAVLGYVGFLSVTAVTDRPSMAGCSPTVDKYTHRVEIRIVHKCYRFNSSFSMKLSLFVRMLAACSDSPLQYSAYYLIVSETVEAYLC